MTENFIRCFIFLCVTYFVKGQQYPDVFGSYLAINTLGRVDNDTEEVIRRRLEVNWYGLDRFGDEVTVGLFMDDDSLVEMIDVELYKNDGFLVFEDIQLDNLTNAEIGYTRRCVFPYYTQVINATDQQPMTEKRCIEARPDWMWEYKDQLGQFAISELMLTAAHDAAAYRMYQGRIDNTRYKAFVYTQEENFEAQFQYGVRFIDIRMGWYENSSEFWFVHSAFKVNPFDEGIQSVKNFLSNSKDIVIFDVHSFNSFEGVGSEWTDEVHRNFQDILEAEFGRWWVAPDAQLRDWSLTLDEIWSRPGLPQDEGRIIVMYQDESHRNESLYFSNMIERWGNKDTPEELKAYLDEQTELARQDPPTYTPWRPNCQMTGSAPDIIFKLYSGLREMADLVNRNNSIWWRTEYADLANTYTLIDYFMASDMVRIGIERNLRLAAERTTTTARVTSSTAVPFPCPYNGIQCPSSPIYSDLAADANACSVSCSQSSGCNYWSFDTTVGFCTHYDICPKPYTSGSQFVSGEKACVNPI